MSTETSIYAWPQLPSFLCIMRVSISLAYPDFFPNSLFSSLFFFSVIPEASVLSVCLYSAWPHIFVMKFMWNLSPDGFQKQMHMCEWHLLHSDLIDLLVAVTELTISWAYMFYRSIQEIILPAWHSAFIGADYVWHSDKLLFFFFFLKL